LLSDQNGEVEMLLDVGGVWVVDGMVVGGCGGGAGGCGGWAARAGQISREGERKEP